MGNESLLTTPGVDLFNGRPPSGAIRRLIEDFAKRVLLPAMEQEARERPRCKRCGRPLSAARSIDNGYGPSCMTMAGSDTVTSPLPLEVS